MPQAASLNVASASPFDSLPFHAEQKSSRTAAVIMLMLLVPVLCLVLVPVGLVLAFAPHQAWDAFVHKPLAAAMLTVGLLAWAALFLVPAKRILQRFGNQRRVTVTAERVTVGDQALFGSACWSVPLADFRGIAHHVRATLSGVRHELILVHPVRGRSVLLHSADAVAQATIDRATALFRLPQIPARELYRVTQSSAQSSVIEPLPEPQLA